MRHRYWSMLDRLEAQPFYVNPVDLRWTHSTATQRSRCCWHRDILITVKYTSMSSFPRANKEGTGLVKDVFLEKHMERNNCLAMSVLVMFDIQLLVFRFSKIESSLADFEQMPEPFSVPDSEEFTLRNFLAHNGKV